MADELGFYGSVLSAGTNLLGGVLQNNAQAANNAANISAQIQRDQFNAAQVAGANERNIMFQSDTNQLNRDFMWNTNMANQAMQRETNEWNAAQVAKQMEFQERLSSTAYQRAMADMRKAGLNPILAYQQGGASSMPGAAPVGIAPKNLPFQATAPHVDAYTGPAPPRQEAATHLGAAVGGVATSAIDALQKIATVKKTEAETENLNVDYDRKVHEVAKTEAEVANVKAATDRIVSEIKNNEAYNRVLRANGVTAEQAAIMGAIDIIEAQKFGGKYRPDAKEQLMRSLLDLAQQVVQWKTGDPLPKLPTEVPKASKLMKPPGANSDWNLFNPFSWFKSTVPPT